MHKVNLNNTYGYKNFISNEEKFFLLNWCENNNNKFITNGFGRKCCILKDIDENVSELVAKIKDRIIQLENITEWVEEPSFYDYIGINTKGGAIHKHKDFNINGHTHTRYNVILSYPEDGGHSKYGGVINVLEENMVWRCVAGKVEHESTEVIGDTPRITLSLGFQIKNLKNDSRT
jgi:hypothetical protein